MGMLMDGFFQELYCRSHDKKCHHIIHLWMKEWTHFYVCCHLHCQDKKKNMGKFLQSCTYLILKSAYQYLNVTNMHLFADVLCYTPKICFSCTFIFMRVYIHTYETFSHEWTGKHTMWLDTLNCWTSMHVVFNQSCWKYKLKEYQIWLWTTKKYLIS